MNLSEALLDSWDRQARIVATVAERIDDSNRLARPCDDGMLLFEQLAHIHHTRRFWLRQLSEARADALPKSMRNGWEDPVEDLASLREMLAQSASAIRETMSEALGRPLGKIGFYDNAVLFLQHMIWHEGWHVGQIMTSLRLAGQDPGEEWEEAHLWGEWRTEEW